MIFSYFLPESIGSYFVLSKRVASIFISQRTIRVAVIRAARSQRFIEKLVEESISNDQEIPREERISQALARALKDIPTPDLVISILPGTSIINKMSVVPAMSIEKIKMIIPFEIEAALPFSLNESAIDCIVFPPSPSEQSAHVLALATRKAIVQEHRALFASCTIQPSIITTEIAALVGLFSDTVQLHKTSECSLIICIELGSTIILMVEQQRIVLVRTIAQDINDMIQQESTTSSSIDTFLQEIIKTVHYASSLISSEKQQVMRLILCGPGIEYKELCDKLNALLDKECELLTINKLLHSGAIHSASSLTQQFLLPLAAALPAPQTADFNLDRDSAEAAVKKSLLTQFIIAVSMLGFILTTFVIMRTLTLRKLKHEMIASEKEAIDLLVSKIPLKIPKSATLDMANKVANATVANQEEVWFSLSSKNRSLVLFALQELSSHIDREKLGLKLQEVTISENTGTMLIKGEVKGFPELNILEENLRSSNFFKNVPKLQEKKFTAKISLDINQEE